MFRTVVLSLVLALASSARAEDVPLESCGPLVVVHASAGSKSLLLLVDTGATSMLSLASFAHDGDPLKIQITSWNNTMDIHAREVTLADLVIGEHHLRNLALPAVDLSAIGRACGKKVDGILGMDLLEQLGASVDFKKRVARLTGDGPAGEQKAPAEQMSEFYRQFGACGDAFDRRDEAAFAACLDPQFVLLTINGDYYGRDAVMEYFRKYYFHQVPLLRLSFRPRAYHSMGDAVWLEYELSITMQEQVIEARGTALLRKTGEKWLLVNMHHSPRPPDGLCSGNTSDTTCETNGKNYSGNSTSIHPF
jgi:predicted aspartyl protease